MLNASQRRYPRNAPAHDDHPAPAELVPFGRYGGGLFTGHAVGLFIAVGLLFVALIAIPAARWFFGTTILLGGLFGILLWIRHR